MGDVGDTVAMVEKAMEHHPQADYVGMVGIRHPYNIT